MTLGIVWFVAFLSYETWVLTSPLEIYGPEGSLVEPDMAHR